MRHIRTILAFVLMAALPFTAPAATVTGTIKLADDSLFSGTIVFRPFSTPFVDNPFVITTKDITTTTTNGAFSVTLLTGRYRVFIGYDTKPVVISVPDDTDSHAIESLVEGGGTPDLGEASYWTADESDERYLSASDLSDTWTALGVTAWNTNALASYASAANWRAGLGLSEWTTNAAFELDNVSDVVLDIPDPKQALIFDGSYWRNSNMVDVATGEPGAWRTALGVAEWTTNADSPLFNATAFSSNLTLLSDAESWRSALGAAAGSTTNMPINIQDYLTSSNIAAAIGTITNAYGSSSNVCIYFPRGVYNLDGNVGISANYTLRFDPGATIYGTNTFRHLGRIDSGPWQIFSPDLVTKFNQRYFDVVYFEWWGAVPASRIYSPANRVISPSNPDCTAACNRAISSWIGTGYSERDYGIKFHLLGYYALTNGLFFGYNHVNLYGKGTRTDGSGFVWCQPGVTNNATNYVIKVNGPDGATLKDFAIIVDGTTNEATRLFCDILVTTQGTSRSRKVSIENVTLGDVPGGFDIKLGTHVAPAYAANYGIYFDDGVGNNDFHVVDKVSIKGMRTAAYVVGGMAVYIRWLNMGIEYCGYGFEYPSGGTAIFDRIYASRVGHGLTNGAFFRLFSLAGGGMKASMDWVACETPLTRDFIQIPAGSGYVSLTLRHCEIEGCDWRSVHYISVSNPGTGYTNAPTVTCYAGRGAAATSSITGDAVTSVTMTSNGSNYVDGVTVTFTGGGGTGAAGIAEYDVNLGTITNVLITAGGSGYTNAPAVAFSNPASGTCTAVAEVENGQVKQILVTASTVTNVWGQSRPFVVISGGGGSGAAGYAYMTPYSKQNLIYNDLEVAGTITMNNCHFADTLSLATPSMNSDITPLQVTMNGCFGLSSINVNMQKRVSTAKLVAGGTGYTIAPAVHFIGGGGSGASGRANISGGSVTSISILDGGHGYTSTPTVVLAGGDGTGASYTCTLSTVDNGNIGLEVNNGTYNATLSSTSYWDPIEQVVNLKKVYSKWDMDSSSMANVATGWFSNYSMRRDLMVKELGIGGSEYIFSQSRWFTRTYAVSLSGGWQKELVNILPSNSVVWNISFRYPWAYTVNPFQGYTGNYEYLDIGTSNSPGIFCYNTLNTTDKVYAPVPSIFKPDAYPYFLPRNATEEQMTLWLRPYINFSSGTYNQSGNAITRSAGSYSFDSTMATYTNKVYWLTGALAGTTSTITNYVSATEIGVDTSTTGSGSLIILAPFNSTTKRIVLSVTGMTFDHYVNTKTVTVDTRMLTMPTWSNVR